MMNQPPPPPYAMPMPTSQPIGSQPIGFEQPPPPLNAGAQQMAIPNYAYPTGAPPYGGDPLIHQQQSRIAALNATPRPYYSGWRGSYRDRKVAMVIVGVIGLIFIVIFLVLFFTVFNKANDQFEEARKKQEEFHNKYFSNW